MAENTKKILDKAYDPVPVEEKWGKFWLEEKINTPQVPSDKPKFSAVLPPPNVTGSLHMGHALCFTLPDIICLLEADEGLQRPLAPRDRPRFDRRPQRYRAGPEGKGADPGEARPRGVPQDRLGLEEKYGGIITGQLKKLGCSLDWTRERFTMDAGLSRAVLPVFDTF